MAGGVMMIMMVLYELAVNVASCCCSLMHAQESYAAQCTDDTARPPSPHFNQLSEVLFEPARIPSNVRECRCAPLVRECDECCCASPPRVVGGDGA